MKIKSIKGGKSKGEVVEFSPEEKIVIAVKEAVSKGSKEGEIAWAESTEVLQKSNFDLEKSKSGYQSKQYKASGKVIVSAMRAEDSRKWPSKKNSFNIEFKDVTDANGMPDLEIISFKLS